MLDFESASFSDFAFSSSGLGEDILAIIAGDHGLSVAEDNVGLAASSALDVHEVGVGGGDQSLELVGLSLFFKCGVEEVSVHICEYKYLY